MLLCGSFLVQNIIQRKYQLQYQQSQIATRLMDLQGYASSIANGVSPDGMMNCPSAMFGRLTMYTGLANQDANQYVNNNFGAVWGMMQNNYAGSTQEQLANYQQQAKNYLYQQRIAQLQQQETGVLNQEEKKLELQQTQIGNELAMLDKQQEAYQKQVDKDIENVAPKFA